MKLIVSVADLQMVSALLKYQGGRITEDEVRQIARMQGRSLATHSSMIQELSCYLADRF